MTVIAGHGFGTVIAQDGRATLLKNFFYGVEKNGFL
jgi:hypothetical protein